MSLKRKRSSSPLPDGSESLDIFRSDSIHDRSSTFVAHFSPTIAAKRLQNLDELKSASHRILGWRKPSNQRAISSSASSSQQLFTIGSDDDGEKHGGKRLEKILEAEKVEGAVVVARWYGGVLLGPIRFTHIEVCAREAIHRWKETAEKGRRVEADEHERDALVKVLGERDNSITVLRDLLAEKSDTTPNGKSSPENTQSTTKAIDYSVLPVQRLRHLEKARDASITFLLKKIDQAEERQQPPQLSEDKTTPNSPGQLSAGHGAEGTESLGLSNETALRDESAS